MPKKQKPRKKPKQKLSQKDKFIEYAREIEADETGELFNKALSTLTASKRKKD